MEWNDIRKITDNNAANDMGERDNLDSLLKKLDGTIFIAPDNQRLRMDSNNPISGMRIMFKSNVDGTIREVPADSILGKAVLEKHPEFGSRYQPDTERMTKEDNSHESGDWETANDVNAKTPEQIAQGCDKWRTPDCNYSLPDISETSEETENSEDEMPDEKIHEEGHVIFNFHMSGRPSHITVSTKSKLNNECVQFILHNRD